MKRFLVFLLLVSGTGIAQSASNEESRKFFPSAAPISMPSPATDEQRLGYGFNTVEMTVEWKEPHFSQVVNEAIGDVSFSARHLALGYQKSVSAKSFLELDLLLGMAEIEAYKADCTTDLMDGRSVDVTLEGDGNDIGLRMVYGYSLFKTDRVDGRLALSLHAAYFQTDSEITGLTADGLFGQVFSETESGFLFRPAFAFQPSVKINNRLMLYPYLGISEAVGLVKLAWELDYTVANGVRLPYSPATMAWLNLDQGDERWSGEESDTVDVGTTLFAGFDIGIKIGQSGGELSLGGALSKLDGETKSSAFHEVHVLYSYPL